MGLLSYGGAGNRSPCLVLLQEREAAIFAGFVALFFQFGEAFGNDRAGLSLNTLVLSSSFLGIDLSLKSAHMFASAVAIDVVRASAGSYVAILVNKEVIIDVGIGEGRTFVDEGICNAGYELCVHVV